jgi:hypothetical protein
MAADTSGWRPPGWGGGPNQWQTLNGPGNIPLKVYHQPSRLEVAENILHGLLVLLHGGVGNDDIV